MDRSYRVTRKRIAKTRASYGRTQKGWQDGGVSRGRQCQKVQANRLGPRMLRYR